MANVTDEIEGAIDSADRAARAANDAGDALIDAIRADLHGEDGARASQAPLSRPRTNSAAEENRQLSRSSSERRQPLDRQVPWHKPTSSVNPYTGCYGRLDVPFVVLALTSDVPGALFRPGHARPQWG